MLTIERLEELFSRLENARILVYGDLMLDEYLWGKVERISPEAPVPVVEVESESLLLGGAANVARNITSLGCKVDLVGLVGDDDNAHKLKLLLEKEGISQSLLVSDQRRPTTVKTRIIANDQQVVRVDRETRTPLDSYTENEIVSYIENRIDKIDALLMSDYGKGAINGTLLKKIVDLAKKHEKFIAVDPKETHFKSYRQVSIITPNNHEASFAAGQRIVDDESLNEVGRRLLKELELDSLLITLGAKGMALFEIGKRFHHLPTVAKKVYDVTGAGDTVIGVLTAMVGAGATKLEAAYIANQAAGVVVEQVGTAVVEHEQLWDVIEKSIDQE